MEKEIIEKHNKWVRKQNIPINVSKGQKNVIGLAKKEVFDLYIKELKRVKGNFDDNKVKVILQELIYFGYNEQRHLSPSTAGLSDRDFKTQSISSKSCPECSSHNIGYSKTEYSCNYCGAEGKWSGKTS